MYFIKINSPSCFYMFLGATLRGAGDLAAIKEGARFGSEEDGRRVSGSGGRQADNPRDRGWRPGAGRRRAQPDLASQCALGVPRRCPGRVNSRGGRAEGRREAPAALRGVLDSRGGQRVGVCGTRRPRSQLRLQGSLIPVASARAPTGLARQLLENPPMAQAAPHTPTSELGVVGPGHSGRFRAKPPTDSDVRCFRP